MVPRSVVVRGAFLGRESELRARERARRGLPFLDREHRVFFHAGIHAHRALLVGPAYRHALHHRAFPEPEVELEEDAPEPEGGLDALLVATAAELEGPAQLDDGFETRRVTLVVF